MSPEQAAGRLDQLGPPSDVHSLGATLYCLLTGAAPVEYAVVDGERNVAQLLKKVCEGDFPRPRQRKPEVDAGLEAVCLKAMSLRPKDRYASPTALVDDLKHWLAGEPVTAWPEPWTVKTRRWVGRHRTLVTGAAAALLVGLVSLMVATALLSEANEQLAGERNNVDEANRTLEKTNSALSASLKKEELAREAQQKAREKAEEAFAANTTSLAQVHWNEGNVVMANDLLEDVPPQYRFGGWRFLKRQFEGCYCTLYGHRAPVTSVVFSPDGQRLASGSENGTIKVWDARTGQDLLTFKGHTNWVDCVCFSPDGQRLASTGADGTLKVWDTDTGKNLLALKELNCPRVSFSPDGHRLKLRDDGKAVLDARTGQVLLMPKDGYGREDVIFSPDGRRAAEFDDRTVKVRDAATGKDLLTLKGSNIGVRNQGLWSGTVTSVSFSPDGQRVAEASDDGTVKVWDAVAGKALITLKGHTGSVFSVSFSPDGQRLASAGGDGTVKLWDVGAGQDLLQRYGGRVSLTEDERWLRGNQRLRSFGASLDGATNVCFSADGNSLALASKSGLGIWNVLKDQAIPIPFLTLEGNFETVLSMSFSPDGKRLALVRDDKTVTVWDLQTGQTILVLKGHFKTVLSMSFSPDGKRLASASGDNTVKIWDAQTGQVLLTLKGHTGGIRNVSFSADGKRLASASGDNTVKIWDAQTGQVLLTLKGHTGGIRNVSFSADGQCLDTAGERMVKVWDAQTGQDLLTVKCDYPDRPAKAAKADGMWPWAVTFVVTSDAPTVTRADRADETWPWAWSDGAVTMWNVRNVHDFITLKGHPEAVEYVSFSTDGKRLASASKDGTVKVWEVSTGKDILTLKGLSAWVERRVNFSLDGKRIIHRALSGYGSGDDFWREEVWNAESGELLFTREGDDAAAPAFFSGPITPDGKKLAKATSNRIQLIDLAPPSKEELAYREMMSRSNPKWQKEQAIHHEKEKNWYAAAFHWSWFITAEPQFELCFKDGIFENPWKRLDDACRQLKSWKHAEDACTRLAREHPAPDFAAFGGPPLPGFSVPWMDFLFAKALHRLGNQAKAKAIFEQVQLPKDATKEQRQTYETLRREAALELGLEKQ